MGAEIKVSILVLPGNAANMGTTLANKETKDNPREPKDAFGGEVGESLDDRFCKVEGKHENGNEPQHITQKVLQETEPGEHPVGVGSPELEPISIALSLKPPSGVEPPEARCLGIGQGRFGR